MWRFSLDDLSWEHVKASKVDGGESPHPKGRELAPHAIYQGSWYMLDCHVDHVGEKEQPAELLRFHLATRRW